MIGNNYPEIQHIVKNISDFGQYPIEARLLREGTLPGPIFIWIGLILDMGLYQRKIGNYLRLGIRKIRLTNGNVRGVGGLRGFRGMRIRL
jgi:hypothetical protein